MLVSGEEIATALIAIQNHLSIATLSKKELLSLIVKEDH